MDEVDHDGENNQVVDKRARRSDEEKWVAHLWLLSGMIKHMELIPDGDKRRLLAGILQGWVRFAANSMSIAGALARDRRITLHGVTYRSTLPEELSVGELARRITLSMPTATARMATNFLGTEKLRLQLEEGLGSSTEPPTRQLMRLSILADLGTEDISKPAAAVADALRDFNYLQHVFARKLYEVAVRFRLPKSEITSLQNMVGRMFGGLEYASKDKAEARKTNVITTMARQRLLLTQANAHKDRLQEQAAERDELST